MITSMRDKSILRRPAFTLVELLVTITILVLLASIVLFGMAGVQAQARDRRARAQVMRIHNVIADKWQTYETRRMQFQLGLELPNDPQQAKLRLAFVVYGGISRRDWREITVDEVKADPNEIDRMLVPMLRADLAPSKNRLPAWTKQLVDDCRGLLSVVLPLAPNEVEFLDLLNDRGEIAPEFLSSDSGMQTVIRKHPGLRWKAINVKKHRGVTDV